MVESNGSRGGNFTPTGPAILSPPWVTVASSSGTVRIGTLKPLLASDIWPPNCRSPRIYKQRTERALTGLRRGEVAGLRWSDIDLEGRMLKISSTRLRLGRHLV